jgi:hypothetical protein
VERRLIVRKPENGSSLGGVNLAFIPDKCRPRQRRVFRRPFHRNGNLAPPLREKGLLPNLNTGLPLYPPDGVPPLFFIWRFHIHLCVHKVSQQACLNDEGEAV